MNTAHYIYPYNTGTHMDKKKKSTEFACFIMYTFSNCLLFVCLLPFPLDFLHSYFMKNAVLLLF